MKSIVDNTKTDKNTCHSYLDVYEGLFLSKKDTCKNILEIGIAEGGSIKLWFDYFKNANIYGLDINIPNNRWKPDFIDSRYKLIQHNAYDEQFIENQFKNIKFDIIIDDGPHTKESMLFVAKHYSKLLTDDGILVIEDIQAFDWIPDIINSFPEEDSKKVKVFDRRVVKNRYDDVLVVLKK